MTLPCQASKGFAWALAGSKLANDVAKGLQVGESQR